MVLSSSRTLLRRLIYAFRDDVFKLNFEDCFYQRELSSRSMPITNKLIRSQGVSNVFMKSIRMDILRSRSIIEQSDKCRTSLDSWVEISFSSLELEEPAPAATDNVGVHPKQPHQDLHLTHHATLFEILDGLAADTCARYLTDSSHDLDPAHLPTFRYTLATLLVDSVRYDSGSFSMQKTSMIPGLDTVLLAFVSGVGKSSIEIKVQVCKDGTIAFEGFFLFVAKPVVLDVAEAINTSVPSLRNDTRVVSADVVQLCNEFPERTTKRKDIINNIDYDKIDFFNKSYIPRLTNHLTSFSVIYPKHRNRFGFLFGGYAIRQSLELAWILAVQIVSSAQLGGIDSVHYRFPINVGSIVMWDAYCVLQFDDEIQIQVFSTVKESGRNVIATSMVFWFGTGIPKSQSIGVSKTNMVSAMSHLSEGDEQLHSNALIRYMQRHGISD